MVLIEAPHAKGIAVFSRLRAALTRSTDRTTSSVTASAESSHPVATTLLGRYSRLDQPGSVEPGTVVIVVDPEAAPVVRRPGELLLPRLAPWGPPRMVLPVSTAAVPADVTVEDLVTLDGYRLRSIRVRLILQLSDDEAWTTLIGMLHDLDGSPEPYLLQQVQTDVERVIRAALRTSRLRDLRDRSVSQVLDTQWLPTAFAGGLLRLNGVTVQEVDWGDENEDTIEIDTGQADTLHPVPTPRPGAKTAASPRTNQPRRVSTSRQPAAPEPAAAAPSAARDSRSLQLSIDARLERLWQRFSSTPLIGIAGAKISSRAVVIAVPQDQPGQYEISRIREEYVELFADSSLHLLVTAATSYGELVRAWYKQTDFSHLNHPQTIRLLDVESDHELEVLRLQLDSAAEDSDLAAGADFEALRRLVPHRIIEIVEGDDR